jgi:acyl-ACP thioesterase
MDDKISLLWRETFNVRAYEAGPSGQATIQSVCNYLQEAAANHAHHLGVSAEILIRQRLTWVLSRFHVRIYKYPFWRQPVVVETWPSDKDSYYALRDFRIFHAEEEIGVATSSWMLLNIDLRRPAPLPDLLNEMINTEQGRSLTDAFEKLPKTENFDRERFFDVRLSDLDMNKHVNNVNYIEWGLESLPAEFTDHYQLRGLEISYRAESFFGDRVISKNKIADADGAGSVIHSLVRENDGKELCRMMTTWRPKK